MGAKDGNGLVSLALFAGGLLLILLLSFPEVMLPINELVVMSANPNGHCYYNGQRFAFAYPDLTFNPEEQLLIIDSDGFGQTKQCLIQAETGGITSIYTPRGALIHIEDEHSRDLSPAHNRHLEWEHKNMIWKGTAAEGYCTGRGGHAFTMASSNIDDFISPQFLFRVDKQSLSSNACEIAAIAEDGSTHLPLIKMDWIDHDRDPTTPDRFRRIYFDVYVPPEIANGEWVPRHAILAPQKGLGLFLLQLFPLFAVTAFLMLLFATSYHRWSGLR